MGHATSARLTLVLIARVPSGGVANFRAYEEAVLPLLSEFGGLLERRLRNSDGTIEVHIVSFDSDRNFQRFRSDPRRASVAHLMEASAANNEFFAGVCASSNGIDLKRHYGGLYFIQERFIARLSFVSDVHPCKFC
jgi:antibiotic biosynthesis monooxygenase (ABM) superfamily enzyme